MTEARRAPGEVRDAILAALSRDKGAGMSVREIHAAAERSLGGPVARSSVRSYLLLNTDQHPARFERVGRGQYRLKKKK
jgi:hypothetical protein